MPVNRGIHTASKSSPAVDESGIYVGADDGWFYRFGWGGETRWKFRAPQAEFGFHATAALDQKLVYVGAYNGFFYALRKADGGVHWSIRLGVAIGASAAVTSDAIYVAVETADPNGFVVKLARRDGRLLWASAGLGEQPHSSPALDEAGGRLFVGDNSGMLSALDLATGVIRWRTPLGGAIKATPLWVDGRVFVSSWAGKFYALDASSGRVLWERRLIDGESAPRLIADRKRAEREMGSAVAVPGGFVVVGARDGTLRAFASVDGKPAWTYQLGYGRVMASGRLVGGELWYPCGETALCRLDAERGRLVERWPLSAGLSGEPVFWQGQVAVSLDAPGGLVVLRAPK
jgi:outer membrane protein assembly factor BamB